MITKEQYEKMSKRAAPSSAVAQGMKLREDATASIAKIKEDAEDIRFEAQQQQAFSKEIES